VALVVDLPPEKSQPGQSQTRKSKSGN